MSAQTKNARQAKMTVVSNKEDKLVSLVEKAPSIETPSPVARTTKAGRPRLDVSLADKVLFALQNNVSRSDIATNFNVHPSTVAAIATGAYYIRNMYEKAGKQFPIPETSPRYTRSGVKGTRTSKKHSEAYNAVASEAKARLDTAIATARNEYNHAIEQASKLDAAQVEQAKAEQAKAQAVKAQVESAKLQARIATETAKMEKMQARIAEFTRAFTASK